jgi:predicted nucleic acid-binding protein
MPNAFVDTNILVYAADEKLPKNRKTVIARELLRQPGLHYSVQVLSEFIASARHPAKLNLSRERERRWLQAWLLRPVASLTTETFVQALAIHARYQISHWDSLILASAKESGCFIVYSEDLTHDQDFGGVKVINPFL